eukprot:jgi/Mesvir1/16189/Mv08453-RA.2
MGKQQFGPVPLAAWSMSCITKYYKDETTPLVLTRKVFAAFLSLCYLSAFASLHSQYSGLYSKAGLLPVSSFLNNIDRSLGASAGSLPAQFSELESLVWLYQPLGIDVDAFCELLCVAGTLLAFCAFLQACTTRGGGHAGVYAALWCLYFSLYRVGQTFLSFQWDVLLLEAGFLSVFLMPWLRARADTGPPIQGVWLLRVLTFKLMLLSGVVKLQSACPTWLHLTALHYHFATQCIPTPLAWYAHRMPSLMLQAGVAFTFIAEGPATWLLIAPHRVARNVGATVQIALQLMIILTGNYTFFNWLTIALSVIHLDDVALMSAGAPFASLWRRIVARCAGWLPAGFVGERQRPRASAPQDDSHKPLLQGAKGDDQNAPRPDVKVTDSPPANGRNSTPAASNRGDNASAVKADPPANATGPVAAAAAAAAAAHVQETAAASSHAAQADPRPAGTQSSGAKAACEASGGGASSVSENDKDDKTSNLAARAAWVVTLGLLLASTAVMFRLERHVKGGAGQGGDIRGMKEGDWQISLAFTVAQMDAWVAWLMRWTFDYLVIVFVLLPVAVTAREIARKRGSLSVLSTTLKIAFQVAATVLGLIMLSVAARPFMSICPPSVVEKSLLPPAPHYLQTTASRLHVANAYGLFRHMTGVGPHGTVARPEIIIEGSNDMSTWRPYEFRYKPGDVTRAPPIAAPHQPRLDWWVNP